MAQVEQMNAETNRMKVEQAQEKDTAELAVKMRDLDLKELELLIKAASTERDTRAKLITTDMKETANLAREEIKAQVAKSTAKKKESK